MTYLLYSLSNNIIFLNFRKGLRKRRNGFRSRKENPRYSNLLQESPQKEQ